MGHCSIDMLFQSLEKKRLAITLSDFPYLINLSLGTTSPLLIYIMLLCYLWQLLFFLLHKISSLMHIGESLLENEQTIGASAYVLGYRVGALAAGAGGLILQIFFLLICLLNNGRHNVNGCGNYIIG